MKNLGYGLTYKHLKKTLRSTYAKHSINVVSAVLDPQITHYTRRFSPQLCCANYPLQYPHIRILPPAIYARQLD